MRALLVAWVMASVLAAPAAAEQASQPTQPAAGGLDTGAFHNCALLDGGNADCWGFNADGQLGYGNANAVGDDETPASVGPVNFGPGRTAKAVSAGAYHTCAILDDGSVRCWGFGGNGRLGYRNRNSVGVVQTPASAGAVDLGTGRTAKAISAGGAQTCAILDNGSVLCWGYGGQGQLGHGNTTDVGDDETPASVGPVNLGGSTAVAISAGGVHTCAVLVDGSVRCWGFGQYGRLGYGSTDNAGDTPATTPDKLAAVNLGMGHTAKAISAGGVHTCAVLDDGTVRCWGYGGVGDLGYGNTLNIGDNETPDAAGPVPLGPQRTALAISAGQLHTCAVLDNGTVRCWGFGNNGRLGYGDTKTVGDIQTPDTMGPVDLGAGRTAVAISAGDSHTCARLEDGGVRCWGSGADGRLGYCSPNDIGDDEPPGAAGPLNLKPGDGGAVCPPPSGGSPTVTSPAIGAAQRPGLKKAPVVSSDTARARGLRACLAAVARHARRERARSSHGSASRRAQANRHLKHHATSGRRRCLHLYGRTPGRATGLRAVTRRRTRIDLSFKAPGTDANRQPAARSYLVKQSLRPIRSERDFARAQALCHGVCRFRVTQVGGTVSLTVTDLRRHTTYYYAVAARDNVSAKHGRRSRQVRAKTR
ncbi:MAG: hypothetical protein M3Z33_04035 [Actinomycetota bacterium]|nr:hypothetical protein [Actinomycetota bacterium]